MHERKKASETKNLSAIKKVLMENFGEICETLIGRKAGLWRWRSGGDDGGSDERGLKMFSFLWRLVQKRRETRLGRVAKKAGGDPQSKTNGRNVGLSKTDMPSYQWVLSKT